MYTQGDEQISCHLMRDEYADEVDWKTTTLE
jgi:hypothetical protein